jgi:hypothetical protein
MTLAASPGQGYLVERGETLSVRGSRISRIGISVARSTSSATLPSSQRFKPRRPWVDMTIRLTAWRSAAATPARAYTAGLQLIALRDEVLLGHRVLLVHLGFDRVARTHLQCVPKGIPNREEYHIGAKRLSELLGVRQRTFGEPGAVERHENAVEVWRRHQRRFTRPHYHERHAPLAQHGAGHTAEDHPRQSCAAMRRHGDQVNLLALGKIENGICGRSKAQRELDGDAGRSDLASHRLEGIERLPAQDRHLLVDFQLDSIAWQSPANRFECAQ